MERPELVGKWMKGWLGGGQVGSGRSRNGCGCKGGGVCGWVFFCGKVGLGGNIIVGPGVLGLLGKAAVMLAVRSAIAVARQSTA